MRLARLFATLLVGVLLMGGAAPAGAAMLPPGPDEPPIPVDVRHRYLVKDGAYVGVRLRVSPATSDVAVRVRWKGCDGRTVAYRKGQAETGAHRFRLAPGPRRLGPRSRLVVEVTKPGHQTLKWILRPSLRVWSSSRREFTCPTRHR